MTDPKNHTNTDATAELPPVDDYANATEALRDKMVDALTPGFQVELDPDEAEHVGAFVEDALGDQDAQESTEDLAELDEQEEEPTFRLSLPPATFVKCMAGDLAKPWKKPLPVRTKRVNRCPLPRPKHKT